MSSSRGCSLSLSPSPGYRGRWVSSWTSSRPAPSRSVSFRASSTKPSRHSARSRTEWARRSSSSGCCLRQHCSRAYTTSAGKPSPASSSRRCSAYTWCGRSSVLRASFSRGKCFALSARLCEGTPERDRSAVPPGSGLPSRGLTLLFLGAEAFDDDLRDACGRSQPQQRPHDLGAVLRLDHLVWRHACPLGHPCRDDAGGDRGCADAVHAELGVQRPRERDQRRLGGAVSCKARCGARAGDRGDVDDQAARLFQQRNGFACYDECAAHVDGELEVPVLCRHRLDVSADSHPGAINEYVKSAEALTMRSDEPLALIRARYVRDDCVSPELGSRTLEPLRRAGRERQLEPFVAQHARDREPDTGRTAGDERRLGHDQSLQARRFGHLRVEHHAGEPSRLLLSPDGGGAMRRRRLIHVGETMVPPPAPPLTTRCRQRLFRLPPGKARLRRPAAAPFRDSLGRRNKSSFGHSVDEQPSGAYISEFIPREDVWTPRPDA